MNGSHIILSENEGVLCHTHHAKKNQVLHEFCQWNLLSSKSDAAGGRIVTF